MGTAFPHKKLSGNGVPTREILTYIYIFVIAISYFPLLPCYNIPCISTHVRCQNSTSEFPSISALKLISKGTCSIYIVNAWYHKIHEFFLKLLSQQLNVGTEMPVLNCTKKLLL